MQTINGVLLERILLFHCKKKTNMSTFSLEFGDINFDVSLYQIASLKYFGSSKVLCHFCILSYKFSKPFIIYFLNILLAKEKSMNT